MPVEIAREVCGQACREIAHQTVTRDLRQHALETVANRKLDTRCGALLDRYELIADFALRRGSAALIAAHSDDPAGQSFEDPLDARGTAKVG